MNTVPLTSPPCYEDVCIGEDLTLNVLCPSYLLHLLKGIAEAAFFSWGPSTVTHSTRRRALLIECVGVTWCGRHAQCDGIKS